MRALLNAVTELGVDMHAIEVGSTLESRLAPFGRRLGGAMDGDVGNGVWNRGHDIWGDVAKALAGYPGCRRRGVKWPWLWWANQDAGGFYCSVRLLQRHHILHPNVFVGQGIVAGEGSWLWRTEPGEAEIHVDRT